MDFREFPGKIDINQVKPEFFAYMPIVTTMRTQAVIQCDRIQQMLPHCEVNLSMNQDALLLKPLKMRIDEYVEVPLPKLPELDFELFSLWTQFDIKQAVTRKEFSIAFSKAGELFGVMGNYLPKISQGSTWVLEKVGQLRQKLPLKEIALGLGADSYSISIFPPGLSFNFPVGKDVNLS